MSKPGAEPPVPISCVCAAKEPWFYGQFSPYLSGIRRIFQGHALQTAAKVSRNPDACTFSGQWGGVKSRGPDALKLASLGRFIHSSPMKKNRETGQTGF